MGEALALFQKAMRQGETEEKAVLPQAEIVPHKAPAPPMLAAFLPDYAAFCPGYFRQCFRCPEFLPGKTLFCARWNRTFPDKAVELPFDMQEFLRAAERGEERAYLSKCVQRITGRGDSWASRDKWVTNF